MSRTVNHAILVGFVGNDPMIFDTKTDKKIASFSIATAEKWRDKNGNMREQTTWHPIVVFDDRKARFVEEYISKGDLVYIEGAIKTREQTKPYEIEVRAFNGTIVKLTDKESEHSDA